MTGFDLQKTIADVTAHSEQLARRMRDIHGTGSDDDSLVTVTSGPGGRLTDIEFDPRSRRLDTHDLRDAVVLAAERAAEDVQAKLNDALSEMTSATGILGSSDIAREMQQRVDEVNRVVKEQQEKLQALQADLTGGR